LTEAGFMQLKILADNLEHRFPYLILQRVPASSVQVIPSAFTAPRIVEAIATRCCSQLGDQKTATVFFRAAQSALPHP
jgi:hypothetical protein